MSASYMRRCAGKTRFENKAEAQESGTAMVATTGKPKSVYRCDQCLGWHIGNVGARFMTRARRRGKRPNKRMRGRM